VLQTIVSCCLKGRRNTSGPCEFKCKLPYNRIGLPNSCKRFCKAGKLPDASRPSYKPAIVATVQTQSAVSVARLNTHPAEHIAVAVTQ
jgi:hypothetical protein